MYIHIQFLLIVNFFVEDLHTIFSFFGISNHENVPHTILLQLCQNFYKIPGSLITANGNERLLPKWLASMILFAMIKKSMR